MINIIKNNKRLITKGMKNDGSEYHVCPGCLRFLGFKNFRPYKIGWLDLNKKRRHARCRKCESDRQKDKRDERPAYRLWLIRRRHAIKKNIPFNISVDDKDDIWPNDNCCPITKKNSNQELKINGTYLPQIK